MPVGAVLAAVGRLEAVIFLAGGHVAAVGRVAILPALRLPGLVLADLVLGVPGGLRGPRLKLLLLARLILAERLALGGAGGG